MLYIKTLVFCVIFHFTESYILYEITFWCVQPLTVLILGCLIGVFMKLTDDISDKNLRLNHLLALPLGIVYGSLMGYLMIVNIDAALIFGGIILGCLVSGKINSNGHYISLAVILAIIFSYGIKISSLVFMVAAFAAFDEMKEMIRISGLDFMFKYRLFLKMGTLILVAFDLIGMIGLLILLVFDLSYMLTGELVSRLNNEI